MIKTKRSGETDFNWPPVAMFALVIGFAFATYICRTTERASVANLLQQAHQLFAWRTQPVVVDFGQALIVTASSRNELTVVTTLSPRGFHPLLAGSEPEVQALIQAYPGAVKLAVVDAALPDYARIARTLKSILPPENIVVLKGSLRSEDIAMMLLDRLGMMRKVRMANSVAAPPLSLAVAGIAVSR